MNLSEIRADIVEFTGDLNLADNPARIDGVINAALKELPKITRTPVDRRTTMANLATGDYSVSIANLRIPLKIHANGALLDQVTLDRMLELYPDFSDVDPGTPRYWCIDASASESGAVSRSLILRIMPPADEDYTVTILGDFFDAFNSTNDTAESWWSVNYPHVLSMMAAMILERSYGHDERERYWRSRVDDAVFGLFNQVVTINSNVDPYF